MRNWIIFILFLVILIFSCTPLRLERPLTPPFTIKPLPEIPILRQGKYLGKFKVSFYWIVKEEDYKGKKSIPLYLEDGRLLGYFCADFIKDFKIESCAQLRDGRIISYLKKKNRAKIVDKPLGFGFKLTPLKSIAVDPEFIKLGSLLFIPNIFGLKINSHETHNGLFYAHDIGSEIKGRKIDIFLGYKENHHNFKLAGIKHGTEVDVYLLE
ncbi:MAG: 3D domain-containing protein [candidate division WOR-3 bacterium]|nr:3D domain-containing protein [candidate division WOR-3 bacterium]MCX7836673.1 3D domain-containing protein [candidate division WOR-3 bacterium]MDW8113686.1 3D domain-containing protein [candidate division WOR-3 bacterium]